MSDPTEEQLLLQSGAQFERRLMLRDPWGAEIFVGFRGAAVSLYAGGDPIFHFDRAGRWFRGFLDGCHLRRGISGSIMEIRKAMVGARPTGICRRRIEPLSSEALAIHHRVRELVARLADHLAAGRCREVPPPDGRVAGQDEIEAFLARPLAWTADRWTAERRRFEAAYGLPGLVPPPAHPQALVLEPQWFAGAAGGSNPPVPLDGRFKTVAEFAAHCAAVRALLGDGLGLRRGIFLPALRPDAAAPAGWLALIDHAHARFARLLGSGPEPGGPDGIAVQWSIDTPNGWTDAELAALRDRGVSPVYLSVPVSGGGELEPAGRRAVARLKAAGLGVGVMVWCGAGTPAAQPARAPPEAVARSLNHLPLAAGDVITLGSVSLEAVISGQARLAGPPGMAAWSRTVIRGLRFLRERAGVRVGPFEPDQLLY